MDDVEGYAIDSAQDAIVGGKMLDQTAHADELISILVGCRQSGSTVHPAIESKCGYCHDGCAIQPARGSGRHSSSPGASPGLTVLTLQEPRRGGIDSVARFAGYDLLCCINPGLTPGATDIPPSSTAPCALPVKAAHAHGFPVPHHGSQLPLDHTKRSAPLLHHPPGKVESRPRDSAACDKDSAVQSDSRAAARLVSAPYLQWSTDAQT